MAITFDAQGNLIDTENNINFFNRSTEQVFPTQDITTYMPETNTPFYQPDRGINTLRFVDNNSMFLQPQLAPNRLAGLPTLDLQSLPANMGVANEADVEQVDSLTGKKKSGGIMDLIMSIAVPGYGFLKNIGKSGLEGIKGLNQRLRGTTFALSPTLSDYFKAKKAEKKAAAGADEGVSGGGRGSRRGDADIAGRDRGGFATDDTAGFF
tara:strand:- start:516 stop:1142 length:627 start_codon:yes stop_codon:yes gene_type:complete